MILKAFQNIAMMGNLQFEPKQRPNFSLLAAGLASELKIDAIPYGRRFPVACSGGPSIEVLNTDVWRY